MLRPVTMTLAQTVRRGSAYGRCALLFLVALALVLTAASARAQTPAVTGIVGPVFRVEPDGTNADSYTTGNPHPGGVPENVLNYSDCEANLSFQFTLSLSGNFTNSYDLVTWAGPGDCTPAAARRPGTATCWPLKGGAIVQGSVGRDGGAPTTTVAVSMRDIASHAGGVSGAVIPATYTPATSDACSVQASNAATRIAIYFFFTDRIGDVGNPIGYAQAYPVFVDTAAQNVGTGFSISEDQDSQLTVSVGTRADSDTVAFNVYCDPPPGQETAVNQVTFDAAPNPVECGAGSGLPDSSSDSSSDGSSDSSSDGAAGDAASDGDALVSTNDGAAADSAPPPPEASVDAASASGCSIPVNDNYGSCSAGGPLQPGGGTTQTTTNEAGVTTRVDGGTVSGGKQTLGIPSQYLYGVMPVNSPTLTLTGLRDGYFYNVAVAAVDGAGNVGPLGVQCKQPVPLEDFWYKYTAAGGQAGGGYCSAAEGVGLPAGTSGLGLLMVASIVAVIRKRRR